MITIMIIYAIVSAISLVIEVVLMKKTPEGWEDENGFHEGKQQPGNKVLIKHVS